MFHKLLGKKERLLFQYMVVNNIITKTLEQPLNNFLAAHHVTETTEQKAGNKNINVRPDTVSPGFATGAARVYRMGHKAGGGPTIKEWFKSIYTDVHVDLTVPGRYTDKMSPPESGSLAVGAHDVEDKYGKKDTNLAWFEIRYSSITNPGVKADNWVKFVRERFRSAMSRSADTPDNPKTSKDESSPTGLKY